MSNNEGILDNEQQWRIGRDNPHGLHEISHASLSLASLDQGSYWLLLVISKVQPLEALTNKYKGLKPRNVLDPQCTQITT